MGEGKSSKGEDDERSKRYTSHARRLGDRGRSQFRPGGDVPRPRCLVTDEVSVGILLTLFVLGAYMQRAYMQTRRSARELDSARARARLEGLRGFSCNSSGTQKITGKLWDLP